MAAAAAAATAPFLLSGRGTPYEVQVPKHTRRFIILFVLLELYEYKFVRYNITFSLSGVEKITLEHNVIETLPKNRDNDRRDDRRRNDRRRDDSRLLRKS